MSDKRAYDVEADARYQGMVPGVGEVTVETDSDTYTTSEEKEQRLLETTFGLTPSKPKSGQAAKGGN